MGPRGAGALPFTLTGVKNFVRMRKLRSASKKSQENSITEKATNWAPKSAVKQNLGAQSEPLFNQFFFLVSVSNQQVRKRLH